MKQRVGYLPENPYFYDYLTGWEFCRWQVDFQIPAAAAPTHSQLLELVGYPSSSAVKQLRQYSKGMLRVGMAQALINDLVFLDEPMSGLDPPSATKCGRLFSCFKNKARRFFNSHTLRGGADLLACCYPRSRRVDLQRLPR